MSMCVLCISPHLRVLRFLGFCRLSAEANPRRVGIVRRIDRAYLTLHRLYRMFTMFATIIYVLQQLIYGYQMRKDFDKLTNVTFMMLCHVTSVVKQVVFHLKADKIDYLIAGLNDSLMNEEAVVGEVLLRSVARRAVRLLRAFSGCAVFTCMLWIMFPIVYRIQGRQFEFSFWTGLEYDHLVIYNIVLLYSYYATNITAIGNTTMDALIVTILDLVRVQLRILRSNFTTLLERAADEALVNKRETYDATLQKRLVDCLVHYKKIFEMCTLLHDIFGVPLLVQFGASGWILCMAAYNILKLNVLSIEFLSTMLFMCCILVELFLYCYHGNEVTLESERLCESIYNMKWLGTSVSFQRSLLVAMERARRPLRPAAFSIIPLSLDTFVKILRSSYSFYAVLRQTQQETT